MNRYSRQISFSPLGDSGQQRLQCGRVLVVGCGALGGTVADLLVRARVGRDGGGITILDSDIVQLSNLHRQTLFTEQDCGRLKVEVAHTRLLAADSEANVEVIAERFDENKAGMAAHFDLLIDATDNFPTRFLLNRTAVKCGKPLISAGVAKASGQILTILPGQTACLECFLAPQNDTRDDTVTPESASDAAPFAVLSPLPQLFAALEVMEAIKILSGHNEAANRSLLGFDLWSNTIRQLALAPNPGCPVCGEKM